METSVELLEGNRAKVTVTIDRATIIDRVKKQYKQLANRYNFPGFRKGKAPRPVIDSALGKNAAVAVVTDEIVNETYPLAIDELLIYPVGQPDFPEDMDIVVDAQPFTYTFEIDVKPTFELDDYEPVEIELPPETVADDEVDEEIDALREHYFEIVDAADTAKVKEDSFVELAIKATDDKGEEVPSLCTEGTQYAAGSNLYSAAFDEQVMGMKKGEPKQFEIDVPADPTALTSTLMGKSAKVAFDITVLQVRKKKLPKLTDEWVAQRLGIDSVDELRSELVGELQQQRGLMLPRMKEGAALAALGKRLQGEVPENLVEEAEQSLLQDFFGQLQRQGLTLDKYLQQQGISSGQFREDIKAQALETTRQDLALDAWAAHEGLEVTEEDIRDEFVKAGAEDPDSLMEEWRRMGQMYLVRTGILRQKAAADIVEKAIVSDMTAAEEPAEKAGKHAKEAAEAEEAAAEAQEAVEEAPVEEAAE